MTTAKKLIEVAMPIKEISAESVRDKSIRHGHISTLHLWWARRPLPVCRAVVFASLVPDPLDANCPQAFRDAVELLLGRDTNPGDPYKPYDDIPHTSAIDPMDDNLRNRLLMFIGKFSPKYIENEKLGKPTAPKDQLSEYSLIKWESRTNNEIIGKARKLIWVAHNAHTGKSADELLSEFDRYYNAIKKAEAELYSTPNRHLKTDNVLAKEASLQQAIDAFLDRMPRVFDPFAGGGAIPLEAARLGCRSYGNDINPVAHIIQKGSLEFPQRFGKPMVYSTDEFVKLYGQEAFSTVPNEWKVYTDGNITGVRIPNRLSFDVEYYANKLLALAEKEIGHYYPADEHGNRPIAYYWARVATCSNPSCQAQVPLLKQFYLANTTTKQVYLHPIIEGKSIRFEIRQGKCNLEGWLKKTLVCPVCSSTTSVNELKEQAKTGKLKLKLLAVIEESNEGKSYRLPRIDEVDIAEVDISSLNPEFIPNEEMKEIPDLVSGRGWGINKWSQMFSPRQLLALHTLVQGVHTLKAEIFHHFDPEYAKAVVTYLGILVDRIAMNLTSFGLWELSRENLKTPFGRQAIPMVFDFPEGNPFENSTGSPLSQINYMIKYLNEESFNELLSFVKNVSSGEKSQFSNKSLDAVISDPPYYDAIAYADLSDFFYVWLKRTLGEVYPLNFATPQTPKTDECTALKHHHGNNQEKARQHFEQKLTQIFDAIEHQTSDIVSIMFAHQSTEAWTTLCNAILGARMNITGSWSVDSELTTALKNDKAVLSSSVTVSARPAQRQGVGSYREVRRAIEQRVVAEVEQLYRLGFRGADLLTACFGQAVSEFGRYQKVEKADGSEVTVAELLELTRESAFNALLRGFEGDEFTRFYIGWLQLYGFAESDFDDAAKFTRVGLSINVEELFRGHILIKNGNRQTLATSAERMAANKHLGEAPDSYLIDRVHRAMQLYKGTNRQELLAYIGRVGSDAAGSFWRVLASLKELLPTGCDDYRQVDGLLTNKDSLIKESQNTLQTTYKMGDLFNQ